MSKYPQNDICEDCKTIITSQPYTDHHYDDENHVYTNDERVICQKCGYDNYLKNIDIELEDGTRLRKFDWIKERGD